MQQATSSVLIHSTLTRVLADVGAAKVKQQSDHRGVTAQAC
jgi:hypothetical protein